MEQNFILTDIMKTDYNPDLHTFLSYHTLPNQQFDYDENYYRLGRYDLAKYKRKFACLFPRPLFHRFEDYTFDLKRRLNKLISLGFQIIITEPWESKKIIKKDRNIEKLLHNLLDKKINLTYWTGDVSWFWFYMFNKHYDKKYNFDHTKKEFDFLYLNKTSRPHRELLFKKLSNSEVLSKSLYSFTSKGIALDKSYELPWAPCPYPKLGLDQDIYELPYNCTAVNIVVETQTDNEQFVTEKIWKPIIAEQLFVVLAKPFYLKELRDLGFKTFDGIIDESYDNEIDIDKRTDKIVDLCKWLQQQNWQNLYLQTESIRKHNAQTFFNKSLIQKSINNTLQKLLEFFDSSQISS